MGVGEGMRCCRTLADFSEVHDHPGWIGSLKKPCDFYDGSH